MRVNARATNGCAQLMGIHRLEFAALAKRDMINQNELERFKTVNVLNVTNLPEGGVRLGH
jgi:hypothetical protein